MRILITGPGGFLGSALAHHWAANGHELFLVARPSSSLDRIADLLSSTRLIRADRPDEITALVSETMPDVIVHTACSYGRMGESLLDVLDANIRLGVILLQSVMASSFFSDRPPTLFINTGTVLAPEVSLYALSKSQFSAWGAALAISNPKLLKFINIRLQQMYGPSDDGSKFITHAIEAFRQNLPCLTLTEGQQLRDFIHVDDVVQAYDRILERQDQFIMSDEIDVGSGNAVTIKSFVEMAKRVSGANTFLDFGAVAYRPNEAMLCVADTKRLRSLGWSQSISLEDGLRRLMQSQR